MSVPIPTLREKNACPIALSTTDDVTLEKSGFKRNFKPSEALGSVTERTHRTISMKKSIGIIILDALSIPPFTPEAMILWVKRTNTTVHIIGRMVLDENTSNTCLNSAVVLFAKAP
jgi:hypothetical protein